MIPKLVWEIITYYTWRDKISSCNREYHRIFRWDEQRDMLYAYHDFYHPHEFAYNTNRISNYDPDYGNCEEIGSCFSFIKKKVRKGNRKVNYFSWKGVAKLPKNYFYSDESLGWRIIDQNGDQLYYC